LASAGKSVQFNKIASAIENRQSAIGNRKSEMINAESFGNWQSEIGND